MKKRKKRKKKQKEAHARRRGTSPSRGTWDEAEVRLNDKHPDAHLHFEVGLDEPFSLRGIPAAFRRTIRLARAGTHDAEDLAGEIQRMALEQRSYASDRGRRALGSKVSDLLSKVVRGEHRPRILDYDGTTRRPRIRPKPLVTDPASAVPSPADSVADVEATIRVRAYFDLLARTPHDSHVRVIARRWFFDIKTGLFTAAEVADMTGVDPGNFSRALAAEKRAFIAWYRAHS
jgi:hypothetical protein